MTLGAGEPLAAAVGVVATLWFLRRRIGRGSLAGVLFFGVTVAPTLGFVDYHFMLFSFVADRYQYLASIGITAVVVGAVACAVSRAQTAGKLWNETPKGVVTATLLVILGILTWQTGEPVPRRHLVLQPHHRPQLSGSRSASQPRQRVAQMESPGRSPRGLSRGRGTAS